MDKQSHLNCVNMSRSEPQYDDFEEHLNLSATSKSLHIKAHLKKRVILLKKIKKLFKKKDKNNFRTSFITDSTVSALLDQELDASKRETNEVSAPGERRNRPVRRCSITRKPGESLVPSDGENAGNNSLPIPLEETRSVNTQSEVSDYDPTQAIISINDEETDLVQVIVSDVMQRAEQDNSILQDESNKEEDKVTVQEENTEEEKKFDKEKEGYDMTAAIINVNDEDTDLVRVIVKDVMRRSSKDVPAIDELDESTGTFHMDKSYNTFDFDSPEALNDSRRSLRSSRRKMRKSKKRFSEKGENNKEKAKMRKKFLLESYSQSESKWKAENEKLKELIRANVDAMTAEFMIGRATGRPSRKSFTQDESLMAKSKSMRYVIACLKDSVKNLRKENLQLKEEIVRHIGAEMLKGTVTTQTTFWRLPKASAEVDSQFVEELQSSEQNFCVSDPTMEDNPIVYCSPGFLELTGYNLEDVLGRNCRFLQGPETDSADVDKIRTAVKEGNDLSICLLNYKCDGTAFWNLFHVSALKNYQGKIINYIGILCEVSEDYAKAMRNAELES